MVRIRRPVAALAWLGVLLVFARIVSGGAISAGSVGYAIATLPAAVSAWVLVTSLGGLAVLAAIILDRPWARASLALAIATIPLGVVLASLSHDSALAASMLAVAIGIVSSVPAAKLHAGHGQPVDR